MRSKIVFVLLALMVVAFGVLLALRDRPDHEVASLAQPDDDLSEPAAPARLPDGGATPEAATGPAAPSAPDAGPGKAMPDAAAPGDGGAMPARPRKLMDRPLRVVGLGWDLLAPGLVANRGSDPGDESRFTGAGLDVRFAVAESQVELERALASGGAESDGADVAVLPLPTFVAASERLRALAPEAFLVVGWSRGREALLASTDDGLARLAATGEIAIAGEADTPEGFLAMFVLDLAGAPPSRLRWHPQQEAEARAAPFSAVRRGGASPDDERSIAITTADATRLVPYVAVAPRGFVDGNGAALRAWGAAWLEGVADLARDVPAAARRISGLEGAPEALVLLERLGQIEPASLADNARAAGLSGRGAVTLAILYRHAFRLLREADILTSPSPEQVPLRTEIIETLVRSRATLEEPAAAPRAPAPREGAASREGSEALFAWSYRERRLDESDLVAMIGLVGGVFEPLRVRVAVRGDRGRAERIIATAIERFGLSERRLEATGRVASRGIASIEALAAP